MPWCARGAARAGGPDSTITPPSRNTAVSATSRAKPISCVTTIIVIPSPARLRITSSTSPTNSGSSADVGSSNSIRKKMARPSHRAERLTTRQQSALSG
jgi:hypothetical protein